MAKLIGRDVAAVAGSLPPETKFSVIDPFAGSCNTLYWILRHVPHSRGLAFEFDPSVYQLTRQNTADLDRPIELIQGDYNTVLDRLDLPTHDVLIVFVAPPWGTALDEIEGLDLRRTEPPITDIITRIAHAYPDRHILFAIQVYEKVKRGLDGRAADQGGLVDGQNLWPQRAGAQSRHTVGHQRLAAAAAVTGDCF